MENFTSPDTPHGSPENGGEVFACNTCSKVFTKATSQTRHIIYCRQKLAERQSARRKCCTHCKRAKIRCDSGAPQCARCAKKSLSCIYEEINPRGAVYLRDRRAATPKISGIGEPNPHGKAVMLESEGSLAQQGSAELIAYGIELDWDSMPSLVDETGDQLNMIEDVNFSAHTIDPSVLGLSPGFPHYSSNLPMSLMTNERYNFDLVCQTHPSESLTVPYQLIPKVKVFVPTTTTFVSQLGHGFLIQHLKSYPKMILDDSDLPPFVHNSCVKTATDDGRLAFDERPQAESLAICKSIVHLYATKSKESAPFIWRTIAMEQERINNECMGFDEWNLIAGLQALTIYILLRSFDSDAVSVAFDVSLMHTMSNLAHKLEASGFRCSKEVVGQLPEYQDWIIMESKRRTVTILYILHILFDIDVNQRPKTHHRLGTFQLPSSKKIWQAKTHLQWTIEYASDLERQQGREFLTYGDLVSIHRGGSLKDSSQMKDINEWYTNMDAFGVLVMMAATSL